MTLRVDASRRVLRFLGRSGLPSAIIFVAVLLVSPSLGIGLMGDDYMIRARVDAGLHVPGFDYAPLDLFTFVSGDPGQRAALREAGVFGWWMAPDFRMSFWRPLSSLTHAVDQRLWPGSPALAHAHSLLWFVALLGVLAALYRRFHEPPVAHLALLLYAIDDARGFVLGWVAHRNALVAATLGFAALLVHDRARRGGWRAGAWIGPALFAAALLGGESALAVAGYLLAHALFIDSGRLRTRLLRLAPYAALSVAWLLAYKGLGYGTTGGNWYLNPMDEPGPYLRALVERLPVLLASQAWLSIADLWGFLPSPSRLVAYALAVAALAALGALIAPLWRREPACRFWVSGAVLSLPPMCATLPMDRLLVFAGVGGMATIALVLGTALEGAGAALRRRRGLFHRTLLVLLALAHLVLAPLLLPVRVLAVGFLADMGRRLEASVPRGAAVQAKTLVLLASAAELAVFAPWMERQVRREPWPRSVRVLASCFSDLEVSRPDPRTLRVRPRRGFLDGETLRLARGRSRPFRAGDEVVLSDMRVLVREVTADARPAVADFEFDLPLDDPSLVWTRLQAGGTLLPWSPPAVGETRQLPAIAPR